jgi:tRNA U34 5-carboxymethylaminomethyl modifying GTPase MnmE/TrmE
MSKPILAIVGRPNVGKSTLFNALAGSRIAIIEDTPGVTRDRIYADIDWAGRNLTMIDTGGIEPDTYDVILAQMREQAQMAIDMFAYRCAQLICEMAQANEGIDTMAFSAGIGENSSAMRAAVAEKLAWLGVKIDPEKNKIRSGEIRDISAADSKIRVLVVPTNEEYMIALDVAELLG